MAVPYPTAARELLRTTLLDAARELARERPWREVTMAQVAQAAGVSRQTVYNEFGSRDEFAQAFVLREGDRFLADVEAAVRAHPDDPVEAVRAALALFLAEAGEHPVLRAVVSGDDATLLPLVTTKGQPLVGRVVERLGAVIAAMWPQADAAGATLLAETLVRLAISHAALPSGDADATADAVTRVVGPYVERLVAER